MDIMILMLGETSKPRDKIAVPLDSLREHLTDSPHCASSDSDIESYGSISIRRMSLGPSGGVFLKDRIGQAKIDTFKEQAKIDSQLRSAGTLTGLDDQEEGDLSRYFNMAMKKHEAEQRATQRMSRQPSRDPDRRTFPQPSEKIYDKPDVDMESVESNTYDQIHQGAEYDPDDLWMAEPRRLQVAATGVTKGANPAIQRIRTSAISELKEFSGTDREIDTELTWIGNEKLAFLRDQASDEERYLVIGDVLVGSARYWYRQMRRSTRSNSKELMSSFLVQYAGHGMSASRQYYHAKKRSEEKYLQYVHRLNVIGMSAKESVKDGAPDARKEHVNHFIDTLDDPDLFDQLLLLNVVDTDAMQEILQGYQQGTLRQGSDDEFVQVQTEGDAWSSIY